MNLTLFFKMRGKHSILSWRSSSSHGKPVLFSNVFRTSEPVPKTNSQTPTLCKSLKLMLSQGLICSSSGGMFHLMPLTLRSLEKLCFLVDKFMIKVGGQKTLLSALTVSDLWKTSGRWNDASIDLFKIKDRHSIDYCLGPTHEESVTHIISNLRLPYKSFPLRLYQISSKYRDEMQPKLGLLRSREFMMKDMYSFDLNQESAAISYEMICSVYSNLFDVLEVDYFKVKGSSGGMGGSHSHEFHFPSTIGQDEILVCRNCKNGFNIEVINTCENKKQNNSNPATKNEILVCEDCNVVLEKMKAIEVAHTFLLGTRYSKPFSAMYISHDRSSQLLEMGCYGLGITRILASTIEFLSTDEKIRWPLCISPYLICVVPPKKGSKESKVYNFSVSLANSLCEIEGLNGNVLFDDRLNFTIGWRVQDADKLGIPFVLVIGRTAMEDVPKVELIDTYKNCTLFMTHFQVMSFFREFSALILQKSNV